MPPHPALPTCIACLRRATLQPPTPLRATRRSYRKPTKPPLTVPVRLLKNVPTFGRRGAIVPVTAGQMRNAWFPQRVAEYIPLPERRMLKLKINPPQRDVFFGVDNRELEVRSAREGEGEGLSDGAKAAQDEEAQRLAHSSKFQKARKAELERLKPERAAELVERLVPPRLDFYRQRIIEEEQQKSPEREERAAEKVAPKRGGASVAADDLMAVRSRSMPPPPPKSAGPQAIYGSVSALDVLVAIRATLAEHDEAARVVLHEDDITFAASESGGGLEDKTRAKHVGEFTVDIRVRGTESVVRRAVSVKAQE